MLQLLDVFLANDEVAMVRYRLRLHSSAPDLVQTRFVIAESNHTHTGTPKPLHIRAALTDEELARFNVRLLAVPFTVKQQTKANCSSIRCAYVLEIGQRHYVNSIIAEEIASMAAAAGSTTSLIHVSDVDELIDPRIVARLARTPASPAPLADHESSLMRHALWEATGGGCISPNLRVFMYGVHCPVEHLRWTRSTLFTAAWFNRTLIRLPHLQMRKLSSGPCPGTAGWVGWHLSYFLTTTQIVNKLTHFLHAHDGAIRKITQQADPAAEVERRVRSCTDSHARSFRPKWSAFDGRLPHTPGWPHHPLAPNTFSAAQLVAEQGGLVRDLSRFLRRLNSSWDGTAAAAPIGGATTPAAIRLLQRQTRTVLTSAAVLDLAAAANRSAALEVTIWRGHNTLRAIGSKLRAVSSELKRVSGAAMPPDP